MMEYILQGNFIVILLGIISVFSMAIFLERLFYIRKIEKANIAFSREFYKGNIPLKENIIHLCYKAKGALVADITGYILLRSSNEFDMRDYVDESIESQIPKLESGISVIGTIASIAPLLGLLGTVLGMIDSLQVLESDIQSNNMQYTGGLLKGIWTALITTAAGLVVAIPSLTVYNYLLSKINILISRTKAEVNDIIDKMIAKV